MQRRSVSLISRNVFATASDAESPLPPSRAERVPINGEKDSWKDDEAEDTTVNLDPDPHDIKGGQANTMFFRDGKRRIDMVLAYEENAANGVEVEKQRRDKRRQFQKSLVNEGLELELEAADKSYDMKTVFLKIHIPWEALRRFAEVMNLKLPIKHLWDHRLNVPSEGQYNSNNMIPPLLQNIKRREVFDEPDPSCASLNKLFSYDHSVIVDPPSYYMAEYSREREAEFIMAMGQEELVTHAQRSQIVWQILCRSKYGEADKIGIKRLVNDEVYTAAFPLHDGRYDQDNVGGNLDRRLLYLEWARPSKWYKKQPVWLVRKYFGERIGIYFAWLGFYTNMLIPAAIVGFLVFVYGLASMGSEGNLPSREICDMSGSGNITLCPACDKACKYIKLGDSCFFAKMTYLFDNPATVFFAIFMSFWATTFLELWKRRQMVLEWRWDLHDAEDEQEPRIEFTERRVRPDPITGKPEPYVPTFEKAARYMATGSIVLFMVAVVVSALLGTVIYRISVLSVIHSSGDNLLAQNAKVISSASAAAINLVVILLLTLLYKRLAVWMVNLENPRTQTEFENSYTFKIFVFEFVNYYSSLIYIAFFKGRFFVYPGDADARKTGFLQLRADLCDPAGCLPELFIQLAIIMVGKQALNNVLEYLVPLARNWWRRRGQRRLGEHPREMTRWEEDYSLQDVSRLALFEEYLEMVLQYGFVTLFVAAFPLAPLFALLNNLGEIRLDAYKMVTQTRRRLAQRVKGIGAWFGILTGVTYTAVVTNGFVIAFTSDFIPRMVYSIAYSPTNDLRGYIDFSLSEFNTSDYSADMGGDNSMPDPEVCQYRGYRSGPNSPNKYQPSIAYWHVFAARLAFVVVFEHVVFALTGMMAYIIPDVPARVRQQILREKLLAKEAKFEHVKEANLVDAHHDMMAAAQDGRQTDNMADLASGERPSTKKNA